jgi:xanthine dehydrogenase accessory factor
MLEILETVSNWLAGNQPVALATVVQTWGSAPRQMGAKMAVRGDMAMVGSVSGGCVETAVIEEALSSLKFKKSYLLNYGVSDDDAWEVGLACGGKIAVLVEPLDAKWWQIAADAVKNDKALTTITVIEGDCRGAKIAFNAAREIIYSNDLLSPEQQIVLANAPLPEKSGREMVADMAVMVDKIIPRPHLVMVGGVHIAMPLQNFARTLGFRVSLVDPREAFATEERFPDVDTINHEYPDEALEALGINENTYIAILTHDPKIDDPALKAALAANPAYIGVLSSKRTHEKRVERLKEAGMDESVMARLHTPIGIDIGAKTPEEIALCVMAEIIAVKNGKPIVGASR